MRRTLNLFGALAILAGGALTTPASAAPPRPVRQPNMLRALDYLDDARDYLNAAKTDKGGHRVKAMRITTQAMGSVWAGIRYADRNRPSSFEGFVKTRTDREFSGYRGKRDFQPLMQAALASLQRAETSLKKATSDKGGYRAKALADVDRAEAEVRAGIRFADRH
jgi:hypothetical protein